MFTILELIEADLEKLLQTAASGVFNGDLTHDQVHDMLVLVRRLKTRLEVLDAEMEEN